jgi:predicted dithiol-disulfide oxidoreductase (DUF899 family)
MINMKINLPEIVTREKWLVDRKRLLKKEKELTHARGALTAARRRLTMVSIDIEYFLLVRFP